MKINSIVCILVIASSPQICADVFAPSAQNNRLHPSTESAPTPPGHIEAFPLIALPEQATQLAKQVAAKPSGPAYVIGVGRIVEELKTSERMKLRLGYRYQLETQSRIGGIRISSPGAQSIRLGLAIDTIPPEISLRFFSVARGHQEGPTISGSEILELIALNEHAGDHTDAAHIYWSPLIAGEEALLLVEIPLGSKPEDLRFSIPQISHILRDPFSDQSSDPLLKDEGLAGTCNLDATCYSAWNNALSAVAGILFTKGAFTYLCSGTLMNDKDTTTYVPYFLTANHCISSQTVASSLITRWFFQAASCDSVSRDSRYEQLAGGAALLYHSADTDTSFLQLNRSPPSGVFWSGWWATAPPAGTTSTSIHHPKGDWKKISFGTIESYYDCQDIGDGFVTCQATPGTTGRFINAIFATGVTEGGSSGSGLFLDGGYLVGTLYGGTSSCSNPSGSNYYGRFDIPFYEGLNDWLNNDAPAGIPDLIISSFSVSPNQVNPGANLSLSVTTKNQGNAASGNATTVRYYRSTNSTITTTDTQVCVGAVANLDAGSSTSDTCSVTAPSTSGQYYYGACVDAVGGEASTTNNCSNGYAVLVSDATCNVHEDVQSVTYGPGTNTAVAATNSITATNSTVTNRATVAFRAGSQIRLGPGFQAREGANFSARITTTPCL